MEEKKIKLAEALKKEKEGLPEVSFFGNKTDFKGYCLAISYLETGEYSESDLDKHDMLSAVVEDLEQICSDYGV